MNVTEVRLEEEKTYQDKTLNTGNSTNFVFP